MKKYKSLLFCGICGFTMAFILSGCFPAALVASTAEEEQEAEDAWFDAQSNAWDEAWDNVWDDLEDDWSAKGHYWQVLNADGKEVCTIADEEGIQKVDELTKGGKDWKTAECPEDAEVLYTYVFMQQKTLLAGQDPEAEREYEEVMRFTVYGDSDVLTMVVLDGLKNQAPVSLSKLIDLEELLTIYAEAPSDTIESLRSPEKFSQ